MDSHQIRGQLDALQQDLLQQAETLVPLVRRAARLAHAVGEPEYGVLFELHLDGTSQAQSSGNRLTSWSDSARQPRWNPIQAFFQDRAVDDGKFNDLPLEQFEALATKLRASLEGVNSGDQRVAEAMKLDHLHAAISARIRNRVGVFANAVERQLATAPGPPPVGSSQVRVFVGHGRSAVWFALSDFMERRLGIPTLEFNRESVAGVATTERLTDLLGQAHLAFLVFTAEDRREDGILHARENVIHEAGLFQGRLGFRKAIILLEDGCDEFSNIHGLGQIRFRQGDISSAFEEIRRVLEREGILGINPGAL